MLELNITVQLLNSAENDIIGIKESIVYLLEKWADVIRFEIKTSEPLQLTLGDKPEIRPKVTKAFALKELKGKNLTLSEIRNITAALVDLSLQAEDEE